ncbi:MAG: holdfast anchoring protein HfaA [Asticcacaulis sp.]|jgi:holdfast attachment protein HfaA|uniref:holdfast anchoring protein HfaA n=1 Tax=Asticcacaulis sp. TaxID=1872648 RepID=UPI002C48B705|nr:holdfast anchoring protein HfaA [Asticcacaulis sp.]
MSLKKTLIWPPLLIAAAFAGGAQAQFSTSNTAASFETGYGLARNEMQTAINPSMRDANGNLVLQDGMIMTGTDNSVYSYSQTLGAGDTYSGAGALGGATAIGNNLQVVVNGSYNTVIVHSTQTNNGNVTATANGTSVTAQTGTTSTNSSLNGQVNLNGF